MIEAIRAAGTVSYRAFATPGELERLLADDLAVLLSERFAGAASSIGAELPAGTVTFLLTDIEGSTRLWETAPEAMETALEADGLRRRVGLQAWPLLRREEAELAAQVRQALGEDRFDQVFAAGSRLSQREAVAAAGNQRGASTSLTV
jgi:class 3 adenylate cyclase